MDSQKVKIRVGVKSRWSNAVKKATVANPRNGHVASKTELQGSQWEPDLCVQLLRIPATQNYTNVKTMVEKAPKKWIKQFLECDGLEVLLESLEKLGTRGFYDIADTLSQLQCVSCLRAVMNSECGLQFIIKRKDYTRQLANVLLSNNKMVKMQVFELLCALTVYSSKGHALALDALNHFKICHGRRYRFDLILEELQSADTLAYKTTLLAFINCLLFGVNDVKERTKLRNEFFGLGLEFVLNDLRNCDDEEFGIQIAAFENQLRYDEEKLGPLSHQNLFDIIIKKIANSPQIWYFHSLLLNLSQLENNNCDLDKIWELLEEITSSVVKDKRLNKVTRSSSSQNLKDSETQTSSTTSMGGLFSGAFKKSSNSTTNCSSTQTCVLLKTVSTQTDFNIRESRIAESRSIEVQTADMKNINDSCSLFDFDKFSFSSESTIADICSSASMPLSTSSNFSSSKFGKSYKINSSLSETDISQVSYMIPSLLNNKKINLISTRSLSENLDVYQNDKEYSGPPKPPPLPDSFFSLPATIRNENESWKTASKTNESDSEPRLKQVENEKSPPVPPPFPSDQLLAPPIAPPLPPPPPTVDILLPKKCSPSQLCNGHSTLPAKKCSFVDLEVKENKFNTLPNPNGVKMKTLNWTKVSSKCLENTIWSKTDMPPVIIDYKKMQELFCQKPKEKFESKSSLLKLSRSNRSILSTVDILDNKRSLAVNIFLKQFKTGGDFVINAIESCSGLSVEKLKALKRLLPEKQELEAIKSHKVEDGHLGVAELFFLNLSNISNFEIRVEAMLQKEQCPITMNELLPLLDKIYESCRFLIQDLRLKNFFQIVLELGNYLNAGSYAGNAVGFKLSTLPKLLEIRSNKPQVTFLHYVADYVLDFDPDMLCFTKECGDLRELIRTPIANLEEEVKILIDGINYIKNKLKLTQDEEVINRFKDFIIYAEMNIDLLKNKIESVKEVSIKLANHFCEELSTFVLDETLTLFADFFEKLEKSIIENQQSKRQEVLASTASMNDMKIKLNCKRRKPTIKEEEEDCVVDLLMKEIRCGTFKLKKIPNCRDF